MLWMREEEDGANVDLDDSLKGTCAVIKSFPNIFRVFLHEVGDDDASESSEICSRIEQVAARFKLLRKLLVHSPRTDKACLIQAVAASPTLHTLLIGPEKRWPRDAPVLHGI